MCNVHGIVAFHATIHAGGGRLSLLVVVTTAENAGTTT
jgi:hypothetical protein